MKKALLGAAVVVAMMVFAAPAFANDAGYLEICKSSTGLAGTPSFTFAVSNGGGTVVVPNNSCSKPIAVTPGKVTVTEAPAPFYTVSSISTAPGSALVSSNPKGSGALNSGPNGTSVVTVPSAPDPSGSVILNYTNEPVTGYIEVCKNNASDAGLTGSFTFTITGSNAFSATTTVPIGHCSLPILVPAGSVTVTEAAPNSVTGITVQNGDPATTNPGGGTATVTVKPSPAAGDTSQEAIVTFANETVQLKICKIAADPGVTQPYTFTAVATGDPTFPSITRTVVVLPGQCQLVPGPYTNPNGTTGWRAGTKVTVSEGVVAGTAVTGIAVTPSGAEVPGAKMISPLPNPSNPAGSDAVILGAGETRLDFTNATEPGDTLKVCENADAKAPATAVETFTVSSPTPAGSTTTAAVPFGSCTIVPNPVTSSGLWLYNSTVTITQNAGMFPFVSVSVSPAARLLSAMGATVQVAMGSGDTTIATYTNDPPSTGGSSGGGGGSSTGGGGSSGSGASAGGAAPGAVTIGSATVIAAVSGTTAGGSAGTASHTQLRSARLMKIHGHVYLVVRVASTNSSARIRIVELNSRGRKIRSLTVTIATNRSVRLTIPLAKQVRVADVKLA
ncbi:MAG TPA: hypothetical protein VMB27_17750 [Solirubrobacteraceae bacterium]|nr:hypothetical protein [Solirubrobacteraceae bacterium]